MPLSIAIVCKNNDDTIGRTLESVAPIATEIVALDSGSSDGTIELLQAAGARIEHVEWAGHIRTKQQALEACTQPWILAVDSDESVEPDLADAIRAFIADSGSARAATVNRKVWYAGKPLNYVWQPERRARLVRLEDVRAGRARWGGLDPHDKLEVVDHTGRPAAMHDLAGTLRHDSIATFAAFLRQQIKLAEVSAVSLDHAGTTADPSRLLTSPLGALAKQLVLKQAWRDGWRGWCAAGSTALATLAKHILLLERQGLIEDQIGVGSGGGLQLP
ncbi:MAG: glycosyltransferase family 2 protein, partial [Planctomycetota bacterium]